MAGSLDFDDRILGEKTAYYCSSSEDEGEEGDSDGEREPVKAKMPTICKDEPIVTSDGRAVNTGPKGVITDWRRFKQLETEKRELQESEKQALAKKLSMTCRSHLDDEREKAKDKDLIDNLDLELDELDEAFLKAYQQKRIEELRKVYQNTPKFGVLFSLTQAEFVDTIDKENSLVTVMIHLYEDGVHACELMNRCLECLAQEYPSVKFCKIRAHEAKLSHQFSVKAVPAILIYKNHELIANFIKLTEELGSDFCRSDVEGFLLEHGLLPDHKKVIQEKDSDSEDD